MNAKTIGSAIKQAREERGYTQEQLSKELGMKSRSDIARYESGLRRLPIKYIPRVAEILEIPACDLFPGYEDSFIIQSGTKADKAAVYVYQDTAVTLKNLARKNSITQAELIEQMVSFCLDRMID